MSGDFITRRAWAHTFGRLPKYVRGEDYDGLVLAVSGPHAGEVGVPICEGCEDEADTNVELVRGGDYGSALEHDPEPDIRSDYLRKVPAAVGNLIDSLPRNAPDYEVFRLLAAACPDANKVAAQKELSRLGLPLEQRRERATGRGTFMHMAAPASPALVD